MLRRNYSRLPGRWRGPAKRSSRRYSEKLAGLSCEYKVASGASGFQHRSPPGAESDGVFYAQRREPADFIARERLFAGRYRHLGFGRRCAAHWAGCEHELPRERAAFDRAQHRAGTEDRRCSFQLENYGTLPLFWASPGRPLNFWPARIGPSPHANGLDIIM